MNDSIDIGADMKASCDDSTVTAQPINVLEGGQEGRDGGAATAGRQRPRSDSVRLGVWVEDCLTSSAPVIASTIEPTYTRNKWVGRRNCGGTREQGREKLLEKRHGARADGGRGWSVSRRVTRSGAASPYIPRTCQSFVQGWPGPQVSAAASSEREGKASGYAWPGMSHCGESWRREQSRGGQS